MCAAIDNIRYNKMDFTRNEVYTAELNVHIVMLQMS